DADAALTAAGHDLLLPGPPARLRRGRRRVPAGGGVDALEHARGDEGLGLRRGDDDRLAGFEGRGEVRTVPLGDVREGDHRCSSHTGLVTAPTATSMTAERYRRFSRLTRSNSTRTARVSSTSPPRVRSKAGAA